MVYHNKYAETKGFIKTSVGFAVKHGDGIVLTQKTLAEGLALPIEGYCIFKDYMTGLEYIRRNKDIHEQGLYVELHAYHAIVFMDFRIVQDNEFFHYAQLHDLLGGRGISSINETLQEVIYQPLHGPFREIINVDTYKSLLDNEKMDKAILDVDTALEALLLEAKKYSAGKESVIKIKEVVMSKLRHVVKLEGSLKNLNISPELIEVFDKALPKSSFEWGILLSWLFVHQLGRLVSDKGHELRGRSWIDGWQLSKYIQRTLQELSTSKEEKAWNAISLIHIITTQQNWSSTRVLKDNNAGEILHSLLSDAEVQQYLKINRHQDILWFNAEAFENFTRSLILIAIVNILEEAKRDISRKIEDILKIVSEWIKTAKKSGYQVEKLLSKDEI